MYALSSESIRFGPFQLDPSTGELRKRGLEVKLSRPSRKLLTLLLEEPLRTRTRAEIRDRLWDSGTFVDFERGINKAVHALRHALGDNATRSCYIETIATEGYRFSPHFAEAVSPAGSSTISTARTIAVLPIAVVFAGDSLGEDLEYVAKKTHSWLLERLALVPGVRVLAQSAINPQQIEGRTPLQAGAALGVKSVLAGELTRYDNDLLLRIELLDCENGFLVCGAHAHAHLASTQSKSYDETLAETALSKFASALAR